MRRVVIIAEAGVNHNGKLNRAFELVDSALLAGADIIKFQTFKAHKLVNKTATKADYQKLTTDPIESQYDMLSRLELTPEDHIRLIEYCENQGIEFLSTPFDLDSIEMLQKFGLKRFKIPSGDITNFPFLKKIASFNKQIILSTGMSYLGEVEEALGVLVQYGTALTKITLLHCNTEYPTPFEDVNLRAMETIHQAFKLPVGYSDHTTGIEVPIAAVALGATIIEKHITMDRNLPGPDHKASLEPDELKEMVLAIRNIEKAMGNGIKGPTPSEMKNMIIARKSIVAAKEINEGDLFSNDNLTVKRPGDGLSPMRINEILGKNALRDYAIDQQIEI